MITPDELKPCPFCGGKPTKSWLPQSMALPKTEGGYAISCETCFAVRLIGASTEEEAITRWNERIEGRNLLGLNAPDVEV